MFAPAPSEAQQYDFQNPESWGIEDLLSSVHQQLPATGINVALLGVEDRFSFDDAEFAILGEPDLNGGRAGGLFARTTSASLSSVVAFSLTPFGADGTPAETLVRVLNNAGAVTALPQALSSRISTALTEHAAKMVGAARSRK